MKTKKQPSINDTLSVIQLKLSDFDGFKPAKVNRLNKVLGYESELKNYSSELFLDENDVFSYVNPVCPCCGSLKIKKDGKLNKSNINSKGLPFDYTIQLYECKECGKNFQTELIGLKDKNKHYINQIRELIPELLAEGYDSLRKIKNKLEKTLNFKISHQTIRNWLMEYLNDDEIDIDMEKSLIINKSCDYSGYYVYDEEYLRINGKRRYRLTLFDHVNYIPVAEKITSNTQFETIYEFIKESTKNQKLISITTDLNKTYFNVMKKLGVKHQLCHFHYMKNISKIIKINNYKRKLTKEQYDFLIDKTKELKQIFESKDVNQIKEKISDINRLRDYIPKPIIKFVNNHLSKHITEYTQYFYDDNIPKTSNNNENYYRQTDAKHIKKIYKTNEGIIAYLTYKMKFWTHKFGKQKTL